MLRRRMFRFIPIIGLCLAMFAFVFSPESSHAEIDAPPKPEEIEHLYDWAQELTSSEWGRFNFDVNRLRMDDIPTLIFTLSRDATQEEAQQFADDLRINWGLESEPGADDGIVLVAIQSTTAPKHTVFAASWGENTFPMGQLTADGFSDYVNEMAGPLFAEGDYNAGLTFALRRLLYAHEYTAPFPAPLSGLQEVANAFSPLLSVLASVFLLVMILAPDKLESRLPVLKQHKFFIAAAIAGLVILTVLSVYGRSGVGSLYALVATVLFGIWLYRRNLRVDVRTLRYRRASSRKIGRARA